MATPFIAQVIPYAFQFTPRFFARCDGQLMAINQNQALFALIGTIYGGNGQTTFALPDLRSRVPMHPGTGFQMGQAGGQENQTLTVAELPTHTHTVPAAQAPCSTGPGTNNNPSARFPGVTTRPLYADAANGSLAGAASSPAGSNQPHPNVQPCLTVNFCIALQGIFPSRN